MDITMIAAGSKMPDWVKAGFNEYRQRLKGDLTLSLREIPLQKRAGKQRIAAARGKESTRMLAALADRDYVIVLDLAGREYSSESLARRLAFWQENARAAALVIGGPEGLSAEVKARCDENWSLGKLTLPHPLVRVVVAEALYRAWSINRRHPYHRS